MMTSHFVFLFGVSPQVSIASVATSSMLSEAVRAVISGHERSPIRWDVFEAVHQIIVQGLALPEVLSNLVLKKPIESCPLPMLYLRRYLVALLEKRDRKDAGAALGLEPNHGWKGELACIVKRIHEVQVTWALKSWLTGQKDKEANAAGKV